MKVAAIQMPTVKDKLQNIHTAGTYIEKIKAENPDFVILPEMFCCPYQTENFPVYAEKEGGPSWQAMSDYARKYHIYLIAGSMPEADDVGKVHVQIENKGNLYYGFSANTDIITASAEALVAAISKII